MNRIALSVSGQHEATRGVGLRNSEDLVPLRPNMFMLDAAGQPLALLGSNCDACKRRFFPTRRWCTHCFTDGRLRESALPSEGVVYASTVARIRSACGHEPPYAFGYVSLSGDAPRIFTPFAGDRPEAFQPGLSVHIDFVRIPATDLPPTLGFCFVPATSDLNAPH